jgi:hypothetical protein
MSGKIHTPERKLQIALAQRKWREKNREYRKTQDPYLLKPVKGCSKCKEELLTPENFFRSSSSKDGLQNRCHSCEHKSYERNFIRRVLRNVKQRARMKNLEFSLKAANIKIRSTCPILGIPLIAGHKGFYPNSPSLDRLDNTKGYTAENVRLVSMRANIVKGDATIEEMEKVLEYMKNGGIGSYE